MTLCYKVVGFVFCGYTVYIVLFLRYKRLFMN